MRVVLISLGVILVVAAVAGGLAVHSLLWLLLILALIVFAIGVFTGRIDDA
jgi:thiosulfate reductase cytochrome b subunit